MGILRNLFSGVCLSLLLVGLPCATHAIGLGPFFEYGYEIGEHDVNSNRYSVGFALDTAVASDTLFNYRLNFGYSHVDVSSSSASFNGLTLNNMFGFGVYRDAMTRMWLGPSVRFNADFLSDTPDGFDEVDLGIGGGFALGANIHTGSLGSAAFTFGYQYLYVASVVSGPGFDETFSSGEHLLSFNLTYFFRLRGDSYQDRRG